MTPIEALPLLIGYGIYVVVVLFLAKLIENKKIKENVRKWKESR